MSKVVGAHVVFSVSDDSAIKALHELAQGQDTRPLMNQFREYFWGSTRKRFDTQIDPQGDPWKVLSTGWIKYKEDNGYASTRLSMRNYLRKEINSDVLSPTEVVWGSNRAYAAIHNMGGNGVGRNGKMPKRQFLGVSAADEAEALEIARDWLHRKIHGLPD